LRLSVATTRTETTLLRSYATAEQAIHVAGEGAGIVASAPEQAAQKPQRQIRCAQNRPSDILAAIFAGVC